MKLFSVFLYTTCFMKILKLFGIWWQLFGYSNNIRNLQTDRIPNTNSTIQSQLFEYQIIRIICCNSVRNHNFLHFVYSQWINTTFKFYVSQDGFGDSFWRKIFHCKNIFWVKHFCLWYMFNLLHCCININPKTGNSDS